MLSTTANHVGPGLAAASKATGQSSPEEAVEQLTITVSSVDTTHTSIQRAVQEARRLEGQVAQVLRGAQPGPLIQMLRGVRTSASQVGRQGLEGKKHAESAMAHGGRLGEWSREDAGAGRSSSGVVSPVSTTGDHSTPFDVNVWRMVPQRHGDKGKTAGRFVDRTVELQTRFNNPPCPGRVGCDKWLPHMLPPGGKLTVYGPEGFSRAYRGVPMEERAQ